jgi:hypothetical protein
MRFVTGVVVGAAIGWLAANRVRRDEEQREARSIFASMSRHPSAQRLSRRVSDIASTRGPDAIRRARASIQRRLEASPDDLSMN